MGREYDYFELLVYLAKKGLFSEVRSSTSAIAKDLAVSQQAVSRKLKDMEQMGLVQRRVSQDGIIIRIDEKGRDFLQKNLVSLKKVFEFKKTSLKGKIVQGMGEGKYYMSFKQYQKQFKEKLGFNAYCGTLNLYVKEEEFKQFITPLKRVEIDGFRTTSRTFGGLSCYKIKIKDVDGAIVSPHRTGHPDNIIEVIAPVYLKGKFKLSNDDTVTLTV